MPRSPEADRDPERLLQRLEWTVLRRLDGLLQGDYRTLLRGHGLDLADLREYQVGDDARHIDWNATARLQTPYVRVFNEDRQIDVWFLLDLSASVEFGSGGVRKSALAAELTGVLARLMTRNGNRVGAILYRDGVEEVVPARTGRRQVLHLLARIARGEARAGRETALAELLEAAHRMLRRRSAVFIVSDFIGQPGWNKPLGLLARRHETVAVRLLDPIETELPDLGLVVMQDAETGEQLFVDTRDAGFRRRFAQAVAAHEQALRAALAAAGVDCLELATDGRLDAALLRFARLRSGRGRAAA
ncbi:MAG: DUF58 domain-containing protein [Sphingomonadaceae bacterium]